MPFPIADPLTVNKDRNVIVSYCVEWSTNITSRGLTQNFEQKVLNSAYITDRILHRQLLYIN